MSQPLQMLSEEQQENLIPFVKAMLNQLEEKKLTNYQLINMIEILIEVITE